MPKATIKTRSNPGRRLEQARRAGGFTRQDVAQRLNVPVVVIKYLDRWELEKITDKYLSKTVIRQYALLVDLNPAQFEQQIPYKPPKQDRNRPMIILSRLSLSAVSVMVGILVIGFLAWRTFVATAHPNLRLDQPTAGLMADQPTTTVNGQTSEQAQVYVNGFNVPVDPEGRFSTSVILTQGANTITVTAINSFGRQTQIKRNVNYSP